MNIHEYQAKSLLKKYGAAVLGGGVAYTPAEAVDAAKALGGPVWVVKAQIHAGGRGKGGGVKVVKSIQEVEDCARNMLGMQLVTHQTGPEGKEVRRVYIEDAAPLIKSFICRFLWIGHPGVRRSSPPPKAGWISRKWRPKRRKKSIPSPSTRPRA
ncbi:hypothetical protein JCM17844_25630 [Iodidimonas gelatinilytica]|uniref:ATP-grasp fold succinyl-CoA synthetase-type domain-containing protein n=1 Tax=Iodidimonas gelatinilytica TaxID=1236966 RepID=A0A5A7MSZ2_9PROT|nr:hypothetical protein JCM17844_25630 [Iodidimonas gelatinilytica]